MSKKWYIFLAIVVLPIPPAILTGILISVKSDRTPQEILEVGGLVFLIMELMMFYFVGMMSIIVDWSKL